MRICIMNPWILVSVVRVGGGGVTVCRRFLWLFKPIDYRLIDWHHCHLRMPYICISFFATIYPFYNGHLRQENPSFQRAKSSYIIFHEPYRIQWPTKSLHPVSVETVLGCGGIGDICSVKCAPENFAEIVGWNNKEKFPISYGIHVMKYWGCFESTRSLVLC